MLHKESNDKKKGSHLFWWSPYRLPRLVLESWQLCSQNLVQTSLLLKETPIIRAPHDFSLFSSEHHFKRLLHNPYSFAPPPEIKFQGGNLVCLAPCFAPCPQQGMCLAFGECMDKQASKHACLTE